VVDRLAALRVEARDGQGLRVTLPAR